MVHLNEFSEAGWIFVSLQLCGVEINCSGEAVVKVEKQMVFQSDMINLKDRITVSKLGDSWSFSPQLQGKT